MSKVTTLLGAWVGMVSLAGLLTAAPAAAAELEVQISKIRNAEGKVIVCLFKEEKDFPACDKNEPFQRIELPAGTQPLAVMFRDIPDGTYAVAVAHNETGKLERNILGIPKFGVGVKADGWPAVMGPPSFAKNKLDLIGGRSQVTVEMRYF